MNKIILFILSITTSFMGMAQLEKIESGVYTWSELPTKAGNQRVGRKIMEGISPHFSFLEIHATTQEKGAKPSPPHTQDTIEEVAIVKEGLLKMTMDGTSKVLPAGSVVLIPPLTEQSMENVGDGPLTYYIMMFTSKKNMDVKRSDEAGGPLFINSDKTVFKENEKGGRTDYFNRATAMCTNFEMHVTQLNQKGPSHEPHSHFSSEIIVVMEGQTEMTIAGKTYSGTEGDLFFINSNEVHAISNVGNRPCRYFAYSWQ
ncbi:MAG TPA: cupin domain-containing protein [Pricia antarctica]|uniref:Cupin domain-containing protein n=2 Tax=root TaxID=1 RepID=A0A831QJR7_9FLAO|nr:cupin domain-containing protein [Pricia antarctica]